MGKWGKLLNVLKPIGQGIANSYSSGDDPMTGVGKGFGQFLGGQIADRFNPDQEELPPNPRYVVKSEDPESLPAQRGNWADYLNPASGFIPENNIQPVSFSEDDFPPEQPRFGKYLGGRPQIVSSPEKKNLSPLEMSSNRLNEALNRDTSNKDSGAKAWFKEFLGNTGAGMQEARRLNPNAGFLENLGSSLGTGLAGGTVVRDMNEKRQKDQDVQRAMQEYGVQKQLSDDEIGQNFKKAQIDNFYADNDTNRKRLEDRAKSAESRAAISYYRSLPELDLNTPEGQAVAKQFEEATGLPAIAKNAKTKSDYYFSEDGKVYLAQSDEQGNATFAEVKNDDGSPMTFETKGMRSSKDRELDRKFKETEGTKNRAASITRTQILANAGITKTQIAQQGANYRNERNISENRAKFNQLLAERQQALTMKNENEVKRIDALIANGKARAKSAGMTDEDIKAIFGDY